MLDTIKLLQQGDRGLCKAFILSAELSFLINEEFAAPEQDFGLLSAMPVSIGASGMVISFYHRSPDPGIVSFILSSYNLLTLLMLILVTCFSIYLSILYPVRDLIIAGDESLFSVVIVISPSIIVGMLSLVTLCGLNVHDSTIFKS